jgi:murein L,D-transpeptidase YcbB/YkuD
MWSVIMKKNNKRSHFKLTRFRISLLLGLFSFAAITQAQTDLQSSSIPACQRLEKKLALYQVAVQHPWPRLQTNEVLSIGMQDPAVALLRQRLCATEDLTGNACINATQANEFDEDVEDAVALFQERHGLNDDGVVGATTRLALNVSAAQRLHQIQINLQRWSRLIALANSAYIWINVPDHRLRLVNDHHAILTARVIVGKPSRQTPEINSSVTRIILNPYWTVPPGIARRDVIPKAMRDANYLSRNHIRIFAANQPNKELNSSAVDWLVVHKNPSRYILRQDPGPHNSLGQIKFEFANRHLVYLHDTPSKALFDAERRLFSSGCVRLEDPFEFLESLEELDPALKQAAPRIEAALESGRTTVINLKQAIPIHLTYITAWVDKNDVLHFWDDVYGLDPALPADKEQLANDLPEPI